MTAYLCAAIDTKMTPPTVVGWIIVSECAANVTRVGDGIEWAEVYSVVGTGDYHHDSWTAELVCRSSFKCFGFRLANDTNPPRAEGGF